MAEAHQKIKQRSCVMDALILLLVKLNPSFFTFHCDTPVILSETHLFSRHLFRTDSRRASYRYDKTSPGLSCVGKQTLLFYFIHFLYRQTASKTAAPEHTGKSVARQV